MSSVPPVGANGAGGTPRATRSGSVPGEWAWLRLAWWACLPGTAVLAARLVYEQTYSTWKHGPQMVGFSLAHGGGIVVVLLLSALLLHLWVLASGLAMLWYRRRVSSGHALRIAVAVAASGVIYVPYASWKSVVVGMGGARRHGGAFLVDAGARGDLGLVRRLLAAGVPVDARDADGDTALKGSAVVGRLEVVRLLVENGADPDVRAGILDSSPLMCAAEAGHAGIVAFLLARCADPTLSNKNGQTALMLADRNGHTRIVELLRMTLAQRDTGAARGTAPSGFGPPPGID